MESYIVQAMLIATVSFVVIAIAAALVILSAREFIRYAEKRYGKHD